MANTDHDPTSNSLHPCGRGRRANILQRVVLIVAVIVFVPTMGRLAEAASPSSGSALQRQLLNDARDGGLDEFSFLDASLIASGIDQPEQLAELGRRFNDLCGRFSATPRQAATPSELAAALLAFLHQEILTNEYQVSTTRVDQALTTGKYNCVASTILFRCLSAELGATPVVMATTSHVFCRYPGTDPVDVETTCPNWFALPANSDVWTSHPAHRPAAVVRELSEVAVLGKLFYNRATGKLEAQEFARACELLRIALALDPADVAARENLLAALNNWSLQRCEAGDFAHAAQLLARGAALAPDYVPIRMNDLHVHQRWALDLCQRQQFAEALDLLNGSFRRRPDARMFDQGRFAVHGLWASSLFDQGNDTAGLEIFDEAARQFPGRVEVHRQEAASILRAVQRRVDRGQHREALWLLRRGLERQPDCLQLKANFRDLTDSQL